MLDGLRKGATDALDRAKLVLNRSEGEEVAQVEEDETEQQPDRLEELSELCPQLTWQQRLIGFVSSFSIGCMFCFCVVAEYGRNCVSYI